MRKSAAMITGVCLMIIACCFPNHTRAQNLEIINYITITPSLPLDKSSWCVVEEAATFPGGVAGWTKYIADSTRYPEKFLKSYGEAIVRIQFIISKEGLATEVKSLDTTINSFTEEATRVIKNSPRWLPAKQNGRNISFRMVQGFNFLWKPPTLPIIAACGALTNSVALLQAIH